MYYYAVPLKTAAIIVGAVAIATRLPGVINPAAYRQVAQKFSRAVWPGIVFLTIALIWCSIIVYYAKEEGMAISKPFVLLFLWGIYVGLISISGVDSQPRKTLRAVWPGALFLLLAAALCSVMLYQATDERLSMPWFGVPKEFWILVLWVIYGRVLYMGLTTTKSDFLAVRGLAILLLFFAKIVVDSANQLDTPWRLVMTVLAYVWAIMGMWFTVSPYRMRDMIEWATANERRTRTLCAVGCGFGAFLILLGVFAY